MRCYCLQSHDFTHHEQFPNSICSINVIKIFKTPTVCCHFIILLIIFFATVYSNAAIQHYSYGILHSLLAIECSYCGLFPVNSNINPAVTTDVITDRLGCRKSVLNSISVFLKTHHKGSKSLI